MRATTTRIVSILFAMLLFSPIFCQNASLAEAEMLPPGPDVLWSKNYACELFGTAKSLIQTPDGGFALAGYAMLVGAEKADFWLVKTDARGNMQWNKTFGGTDNDLATCVIATSEGGFALAGETGSVNTLLVKTDANGNMEWSQTILNCVANSLVETSDGGFAVAGNILNSGTEEDFWLVKTDEFGNVLWSRKYGGINNENAIDVIQTSDGGFLLAGALSLSETKTAYWLVKTDFSGNMKWNQTFSEAGASGSACSVIETVDGGLALAGGTGSDNDPVSHFWLTKMDAIGNKKWSITYGDAAYQRAYSLIQTSDGGFAMAGSGGGDFWLVKTGPDSDFQSENIIEISVEMVPAFNNSKMMSELIELKKTMDTYVHVTVNRNPDLVSSVRMKYIVSYGFLPSTTEVEEMQLRSNSLYEYRVEAWDLRGQDSVNGSLAEYLVGALANFYGETSASLAPIFLSSGIPDYTLTEIIVVDTYGKEHTFYYDLLIKSVADGTYVVTMSPVDTMITDSLGRNIGSLYELQNGTPVFVEVVNQIPGAYFNRDSEFFYLPSNASNYDISFVGLKNGNYTLITLTANGHEGNLEEKTSIIQKGEIQSFNTKIFENGTLTIGQISPLALPIETKPEPSPIEPEPTTIESEPIPKGVTDLSTELFLVLISAVTVVIVTVKAYRVVKRSRVPKTDNSELARQQIK